MRRWILPVMMVAAAIMLATAYIFRVDCTHLPRFQILVDGRAPGIDQVSAGGTFCGAIADGVAISALEPIPVQSGAEVSIEYDTYSVWDRVIYTVSREGKALAEGELTRKENRLILPDHPGTYGVGIGFEWDGWWSGELVTASTCFRVTIGR